MTKARAKATKKPTKKVFKVIPAQQARTNLGQLMDHAQSEGARFVVSRDGQPAVVIMGIEDYIASGLELPEPLERLQAEARRKGVDLLGLDAIEAEIREVRKKRA